jgi:hypothetical protein
MGSQQRSIRELIYDEAIETPDAEMARTADDGQIHGRICKLALGGTQIHR